MHLTNINNDVSDVRCRVCGRQDGTIEHVALRCKGNGIPLETALGFKQASGANSLCDVDRAAVAETTRMPSSVSCSRTLLNVA